MPDRPRAQRPTPSADPTPRPASPRWVRWIGPLGIALTAAAMLQYTWHRWTDILVDFGRELYIPWQITQGKVLYRDLACFNGPFSAYLNALWFSLFGVSLQTLETINILLALALLALLYRMLRVVGNRLAAAVGGIVFLLVFAFSQYNPNGVFNWVAPYSHELTHGIILSVAAIFCAWRFVQTRRRWWWAGAALLCGLVFLTKAEVFIALAGALVAGLAALALPGGLSRRRWIFAALTLPAGALLVVLAAWALLAAALPVGDALAGLLGSFKYLGDRRLSGMPFYRTLMGTDRLGMNLLYTLLWCGLYALTLGPALIVALVARQRSAAWRAGAAAGVFALTFGPLLFWWQTIVWDNALLPLPWLLGAMLIGAAMRLWRRRAGGGGLTPRSFLLILLLTFAPLLLLKMLFNTRILGYGFALALPGALLLIAALLDWIPAWIRRRGGSGAVFIAGALAAIAVMTYYQLRVGDLWLARKTWVVSTERDYFLADARAEAVNQAMEFLAPTPPDTTVLVVPEGVMINYLSRRVSPTPYINFMPPELIMWDQQQVIAALEAHRPDVVVVAHKETIEYGAEFFGKDYGQALWSWIDRHYVPRIRIGAQPLVDDHFGILMMVPRDARRDGAPVAAP